MKRNQNKSYYDDNHKYKSKQIRNNLTCHLDDPMNRAYILLQEFSRTYCKSKKE